MKIYDMVKDLLINYPQLRDNDKKLIWTVWYKQGLTVNGQLMKEDFVERAETPGTITRARRKVQEDFPQLSASGQVQLLRDEKAKTMGEFVKDENIEISWEARMEMLKRAKEALIQKGVIRK